LFPTPAKTEEEKRSLYQQFKHAYPKEHFDEPKTKPSFEKKTKPEQHRVLERLRVYLVCGRWKDDAGEWIPFSSKWLETYEADPPPPFKKKTKLAAADGEDPLAKQMREDADRRKSWPTR
jgi:hypothetical protein